jgi:hypothetical protein
MEIGLKITKYSVQETITTRDRVEEGVSRLAKTPGLITCNPNILSIATRDGHVGKVSIHRSKSTLLSRYDPKSYTLGNRQIKLINCKLLDHELKRKGINTNS